jgi:hypothetical protein
MVLREVGMAPTAREGGEMSRHRREMGWSPAAAHWAGIVVPAAQPASADADAMVAEGTRPQIGDES